MGQPFDTISFLSDYGQRDEFVGVVHSVIRSIAPDVKVLDVGIPQGAWEWLFDKGLYIEIKDPAVVPHLRRVIDESRVTREQLAVIAFDPDVILAVKAELPDVRALWLYWWYHDKISGKPSNTVDEILYVATAISADGIDINRSGWVDAEFVRRVYLDATGLPASPEQIRAFLADKSDSRKKREALIDKLIGSPEYIEHWTNKWADLLQVNRKFLGEEGSMALRNWIKQAVASNKPYDEMANEIITASGSTMENPPAAYYKVLRDPAALMENTTPGRVGRSRSTPTKSATKAAA